MSFFLSPEFRAFGPVVRQVLFLVDVIFFDSGVEQTSKNFKINFCRTWGYVTFCHPLLCHRDPLKVLSVLQIFSRPLSKFQIPL